MRRWKTIVISFAYTIILLASSSTTFACEQLKYDPNSPAYQYPKTPPVIFGKSFQVPSFKLKIIDSQTNKPLANAEIRLFYVWEWLQYPQTENLFPGWEQAHEITTCSSSDDGIIVVPAYEVTTKGWYKGRWLLGRKPKFDHLEIHVPVKNSIQTFHYSKKDLEKLRKENKPELTLNVSG